MDSPLSTRQAVAEEVRAQMARRRVNGSELARRLGQSQPWVSRRTTGAVALDFDDLDAIARALDCAVSDLMPAEIRTGSFLPPTVSTDRELVGV